MLKNKKHIILPGLTTTTKSDWRDKILEIDKFNLKEIALFPTVLEIEERKELYRLLEKTRLERIPHVHLRDDTQEWEIEYYIERFKSKVFNIHINDTSKNLLETKYSKDIYIETTDNISNLFIDSLSKCGGICLDAAHCEDHMNSGQLAGYEKIPALLKKHKIGCAHISAMDKKPHEYIHYITGKIIMHRSSHWLENLNQLDYVKKFVKFLPEHVSIELENSFREQLKAKGYLEKIIDAEINSA